MQRHERATSLRTNAARSRVWTVAVCLAAAVLLASGGLALAHEAHGHPARIHEGSCEALGPVAFRLNGVGGSVDTEGAPIATPTSVNVPPAHEVVLSETTIDTSLETLLAADHAVMVYESDEDMSGITCGNLGGAMLGDMLVTALEETGVPGHVGLAIFRPEGEQTVVTLYQAHGLAALSTAGSEVGDHAESETGDHAHEDGADHQAAATPAA
jgi:hypothetical protein